MATKKISELTLLDTVSANLALTIIPVLDTSSGTTKKVTLQQINDAVEANIPFAAAAFSQANTGVTNAATADQRAVTSGSYANSAFNKANNSLNVSAGGTITGDLSITGNLSITGCTATLTVSTLRTSDHIIDLGYGTTGAPTQNAGVRVMRGEDSPVQIRWNEVSNIWQYTNDGTEYYDFSNASSSQITSAYNQANTANINSISAGNYANAAFSAANNSVDTWVRDAANSASSYANSGFAQANSANTLAQSAFDTANNVLSNQPTLTDFNIGNGAEMNIDGGSGTRYWTGQSGVIQLSDNRAGVYRTNSSSNNALFTFGANGSGNMSVGVEGSLFIGTGKPTNDGSITTAYPGWLVVQNGGKFGGGLDTLGSVLIGQGIQEKISTKVDATGTVEHDCLNGQIFYHTSPDSNWTANFTNLNITENYATTVTLIINQGGTGYYADAIQIGGISQTINWQGNTSPTTSVNRKDILSFSILNNGGSYIVFGQLIGF